jgi:hypothetical protein
MSYWEGIEVVDTMRIMGHDYTISLTPPEDLNQDYGEVIHSLASIRINRNMIRGQAYSTIVHEILETLNKFLEIGLEHPQIGRLEYGLYQVIMDNPEFFREMLNDRTCSSDGRASHL